MKKSEIRKIIKEEIKIAIRESNIPSNIEKWIKQRGPETTRDVRTIGNWVKKITGHGISGGTAIGKGYDTLVLDIKYQDAAIYYDTYEGTIKLYGKKVVGFQEFKRVFQYYNTKLTESKIKKGDIVKPKIGPHKGLKHKVIHDFGNGKYNIQPIGLKPKQIRYRLGAAGAKEQDLELVESKEPILEKEDITPQDGQYLSFSDADRNIRPIWVKGKKIKVGNKGKAPYAVIGKKKDKLQFIGNYFYVDIDNIKQRGTISGKPAWILKNYKKAINGKDLEAKLLNRSGDFVYYINL